MQENITSQFKIKEIVRRYAIIAILVFVMAGLVFYSISQYTELKSMRTIYKDHVEAAKETEEAHRDSLVIERKKNKEKFDEYQSKIDDLTIRSGNDIATPTKEYQDEIDQIIHNSKLSPDSAAYARTRLLSTQLSREYTFRIQDTTIIH